MTIVSLPPASVNRRVILVVEQENTEAVLIDGKKGKMEALYEFSQFLTDKRNFRKQIEWNDALYSSDLVIRTAQTGLRITENPKDARKELLQFDENWRRILGMLEDLSGKNSIYTPYFELLQVFRSRSFGEPRSLTAWQYKPATMASRRRSARRSLPPAELQSAIGSTPQANDRGSNRDEDVVLGPEVQLSYPTN